jgi:hypothetical protein
MTSPPLLPTSTRAVVSPSTIWDFLMASWPNTGASFSRCIVIPLNKATFFNAPVQLLVGIDHRQGRRPSRNGPLHSSHGNSIVVDVLQWLNKNQFGSILQWWRWCITCVDCWFWLFMVVVVIVSVIFYRSSDWYPVSVKRHQQVIRSMTWGQVWNLEAILLDPEARRNYSRSGLPVIDDGEARNFSSREPFVASEESLWGSPGRHPKPAAERSDVAADHWADEEGDCDEIREVDRDLKAAVADEAGAVAAITFLSNRMCLMWKPWSSLDHHHAARSPQSWPCQHYLLHCNERLHYRSHPPRCHPL